jgi:hypothetical protein
VTSPGGSVGGLQRSLASCLQGGRAWEIIELISFIENEGTGGEVDLQVGGLDRTLLQFVNNDSGRELERAEEVGRIGIPGGASPRGRKR